MRKTSIIIIVLLVVIIASILFLSFRKSREGLSRAASNYEIVEKWELPSVLDEISGIEWIEPHSIAAVQDEKGIIFIYDLKRKKIAEQFPFGAGGDYEGLAISGNTAFILRSDGLIVEVQNFRTRPMIKRYQTDLTLQKGLDVEGLTLDRDQTNLLLAVKETRRPSTERKIYAFNLQTKSDRTSPVLTLDLKTAAFKDLDATAEERFFPSELEYHPSSGKLFVLSAEEPKLLVLGKDFKHEKLYFLKKKDFGQPEGLSFSPDGTLYVSNEKGDGPANILQVRLLP